MRLSSWRRYAFYFVTTVLVATGLLWMLADQWKSSNEGEAWQAVSATALMIHGGAAMIVLVQVGGLFEIHMLRGWRRGHNRLTGLVMAALTFASSFAHVRSSDSQLAMVVHLGLVAVLATRLPRRDVGSR